MRLHEPDVHLPHRVLGTFYGGWAIPQDYLNQESIAYTVGVGRDISFDLALVKEFGCKVFAFDPTPIAVQFMAERKQPDGITFVPVGLSACDGTRTFFAPQIKEFDCFSKVIDTTAGVSAEIKCETLTFASLMKSLGHDFIDLLKMDIEGFEYEVLIEMISSRALPRCLLVEFHHLTYGISIEETCKAVASLSAVGYRIFWVSQLGREYGFILSN